MGIDINEIINADESIIEKYQCRICHDLVELPVTLSNCSMQSHIFCFACIIEWFEERSEQQCKKTCPICRKARDIYDLKYSYLSDYRLLHRRCTYPNCNKLSLIKDWDRHQQSNSIIPESIFEGMSFLSGYNDCMNNFDSILSYINSSEN